MNYRLKRISDKLSKEVDSALDSYLRNALLQATNAGIITGEQADAIVELTQ